MADRVAGDRGANAMQGVMFVRQHPEMFRALAHDGPAAAALLAEVALRKHAKSVEVHRLDGWYVVWSALDWLTGVGDRDPFTELIPLPELGPNAVYPEVVVVAHADALATVVDGRSRIVVGDVPPLEAWLPPRIRQHGRGIIFRMRA